MTKRQSRVPGSSSWRLEGLRAVYTQVRHGWRPRSSWKLLSSQREKAQWKPGDGWAGAGSGGGWLPTSPHLQFPNSLLFQCLAVWLLHIIFFTLCRVLGAVFTDWTDSSLLLPCFSWVFWASEVFQLDSEKRKHSSGSLHQSIPVPIRLWQGLNSWYTEQPRPAPHSSLPPSFHWSRELRDQGKGLSSTNYQSRLGRSTPKMVRKDFIFFSEEPEAGLSGKNGAVGKALGCILNSLNFASYTWHPHRGRVLALIYWGLCFLIN